MPLKSNRGQGHGHAPQAGAGGFRNHGAEVSAAAHEAPKGRGQGHGQAVSGVATDTSTPMPASPSANDDVATDDSERGA